MQMMHSLSAVVARVDDSPIATLRDPFASRDLGGEQQRLAEQVGRETRRVERGDVFLGNDKHVQGGLRIDVAKGQQALAIVDYIGRNGARDDPAKKAIGVAHPTRLTASGRQTSGTSRHDMEALQASADLGIERFPSQEAAWIPSRCVPSVPCGRASTRR